MADSDRTLTSLQMTGVQPVPTAVDVDAAAARLSRAITFPTISNQDRSDFDTAAFDDFHKHLAESFPRVHATLTKELLGDPRPYSGSAEPRIGGCDAKYYAAKLATNVFRFTALHVESAADLGRWHGINERVLVKEYGVTIGFFFRMITNLQDL